MNSHASTLAYGPCRAVAKRSNFASILLALLVLSGAPAAWGQALGMSLSAAPESGSVRDGLRIAWVAAGPHASALTKAAMAVHDSGDSGVEWMVFSPESAKVRQVAAKKGALRTESVDAWLSAVERAAQAPGVDAVVVAFGDGEADSIATSASTAGAPWGSTEWRERFDARVRAVLAARGAVPIAWLGPISTSHANTQLRLGLLGLYVRGQVQRAEQARYLNAFGWTSGPFGEYVKVSPDGVALRGSGGKLTPRGAEWLVERMTMEIRGWLRPMAGAAR